MCIDVSFCQNCVSKCVFFCVEFAPRNLSKASAYGPCGSEQIQSGAAPPAGPTHLPAIFKCTSFHTAFTKLEIALLSNLPEIIAF